ncbi:MAG: sensor histidine kinase KdpD [Desulfuromonadales bacterium]|nr:sensor histidine kinase KdpD [Desulfuromonadales bacterium]
MIPTGEEKRPSPDALLKLAKSEESPEKDNKGRLKIFLGYAAGVGKTYAMLESAQKRKSEGADVVVGYVESHGRSETDALLEGLEILPPLEIIYQGVTLPELDIDAVLKRKPQIVLVDELAHTDAPGSRHEKRWQDIEEVLAAGIDVYTTVNVQHFESLNSVIEQITGIKVRETIPDRLLDEATEIRLIDITPDDLLQRLKEGKVYIPEQAARAMETFFRPGNLLALRELSMRRAASRVDSQVRAYMEDKAIAGPWPVAERLLASISGGPNSEELIRSTCNLAGELKAQWHVLYVETPATSKHARENRENIWRNLRFAESLGAQVGTIAADSVTEAVVDYSIRHNVTKIIVGKPTRRSLKEFFYPSIADQIMRNSNAIDVVAVSFEREKKASKNSLKKQKKIRHSFKNYAYSVILVAIATFLSALLNTHMARANIIIIYLFAVVIAAVRLGTIATMLTAVLGTLSFDFFFVPPVMDFGVEDTQYLVSFAGFLVVGFVINTLVERVKERAEVIKLNGLQIGSLYHLSRDLAATADLKKILTALAQHIEDTFNAGTIIFLAEGEILEVVSVSKDITTDSKEQAVADWSFRNRLPAGQGTTTLVSATMLYLPIQTPSAALGVIGIKMSNDEDYRSTESRRLLDAFTTQTAMAIERVQLSKQAQQAQFLEARSNLERALLNSISHDLRTPLVTITGVLSTVQDNNNLPDYAKRDLLKTAREEAERLNRFIGNLLNMTRLEAGVASVKKEPCDIQDLIGSIIAAIEPQAQDKRISVSVQDNIPAIKLDIVLIIHVMVNILENSIKYSPAGPPIELSARYDDKYLYLEVSDHGPGVPDKDLKLIFDKFYRIPDTKGHSGTGLGLSIAKGIVEAHSGRIKAENRVGGGLKIIVSIPLN